MVVFRPSRRHPKNVGGALVLKSRRPGDVEASSVRSSGRVGATRTAKPVRKV